MMGIGKHRLLSKVQMGEALCNLGLSILLVRRWGIVGVAWGTTLPSLTKNFLFWPWYVYRILGISPGKFALTTWLRPAFGIVAFAVLTYSTEWVWPAKHLAIFFLQVAAVLPAAAIGYWYLCLDISDRSGYSKRLVQPLLKSLRIG